MQFADNAIILSVRRFGENSGVVHVLSEQHGMHAGMAKGAFGKRQGAIYQSGNLVGIRWQARLAEQLGFMSCELIDPIAAHVMQDPLKLAALGSACALIETILPERDPHPEFYAQTLHWLDSLRTESSQTWLKDYVRLELILLGYGGFALDLSQCAATGVTHDLVYVSPKSARAVSREAGSPYHDKWLPLPEFLREATSSVSEDAAPIGHNSGQFQENAGSGWPTQIIDGLALTGYFLESHVLEHRHKPMPAARERLRRMITQKSKENLVSG